MRTILFLLLILGTYQTQAAPGDVVAKIGNRSITVKEFKEKYDMVRQAPNAPPNAEVFLEDLIRFEVGAQEAEKRKMENDPAVKERIRQVMYQGLLERDLGEKAQKIKITDDDMKRYYKSNPELRISHILIEFKAGASAQEKDTARKRALEIYDEVKKSKRPFEELVKLYTDDPLSKTTGGDVGWQTRVSLVPAIYNEALKMKVNEIKGVIETQWGFHIIKLTGIHSYQQANKKQLRAVVFEEKRNELLNDYFSKLKKSYKIEVNRKFLPN